MLAYIPYMDPMGLDNPDYYSNTLLQFPPMVIWCYLGQRIHLNLAVDQNMISSLLSTCSVSLSNQLDIADLK